MTKNIIHTDLDQPNHFVFDFMNAKGVVEKLLFKDPLKIIEVKSHTQIKQALDEIESHTKQGKYAAGYISYEAAPAFDPKMKVHANSVMPLLYFGIFDKPVTLPAITEEEKITTQALQWQSNTSQLEYETSIKKIKEAIAKGDTYQVNYTLRLQANYDGFTDDIGGYRYYEQLKQAQRANYSAYLNLGRYKICSLSPELFFQLTAGKMMKTMPMKGTIGRGLTLEDDLYKKDKLMHSTKDQAENVMIVDLLRNDLSKISKPNSVKVPSKFVIEKYPTVYQMTSTVTSELQEGITLQQIFAALFPCGSITGAPKLKTMEIITELEEAPREVYCGSIGFITPEGDATFNVAIRTVILDEDNKTARYGVGGGITWESNTGDEYQEAFDKAAVLSQPVISFELMETMSVEGGQQYNLHDERFNRHIERLQTSAQYFAFPFNKSDIIEAFRNYIAQLEENSNENEIYRLNLFLDEQGKYRFKHQPFVDENQSQVKQVALAKRSVFSSNRFLYHKTTYREVYNEHRIGMAEHLFDVLLWNERGELTEFTIGNVVVKQEGIYWTPPVTSGLLAGTFRASLLQQGIIQEKVLYVENVRSFEEIWLINSLRGWVRVLLC